MAGRPAIASPEGRCLDPPTALLDARGPAEEVDQPTRSASTGAGELPQLVAQTMTARESILDSVRAALGRTAGQDPGPPPRVALNIPQQDLADRAALFAQRLEKLAGCCFFAPTPAAAADYASKLL